MAPRPPLAGFFLLAALLAPAARADDGSLGLPVPRYEAPPVEGETFVFSQFSGTPQVFLTAEQLRAELAAAGFQTDPDLPLRELNVPPPGTLRSLSTPLRTPVIFQAGFIFERP